MVGTDLEGLVPPHDEADLLVVLVSEKTDISRSSLFPLELGFREPEEFGPPISSALRAKTTVRWESDTDRWGRADGEEDKRNHAHFEKDLIILFSSLGFYLLSELDDRLKLGVVLLGLCKRKNKIEW